MIKITSFLLLVAFLLCPVFGQQQCTVDPITGQRTCQPIRKAISATTAVAGKTLSAVGNAITPDPSPARQTFTILDLPIVDSSPVVSTTPVVSYSTPVVSYSMANYSPPVAVNSGSVVGSGWSKSWHKVHGQPVRNVGRRWFGR